MLLVVEGPEDTWQMVRTMMGATNPADAAPGTIRGDLAIETTENLVHGSDSAESAEREIALFFPDLAGLVARRAATGRTAGSESLPSTGGCLPERRMDPNRAGGR